MISGGPEPLHLSREVLAALLFEGGRVYPSSPFAFLEHAPRAGPDLVADATAAVDRSELERALEVLRRPDHALIALTWGSGPQRRTPLVGRDGSFVLAFAPPSGECLISLPIEGEQMIDFLMHEVGWVENPTLGELATEELASERFDVFALEIINDAPPADAGTMTRAAFAGPVGRRRMVVPVQEPDRVEVVAVEERDLRAIASMLLGLRPPPPHPPPDVVIELTAHLPDECQVHTIYAFETRAVAHSITSAGYAVEHLERGELRDHVTKIARLGYADAGSAGTRTFSATARTLETWDKEGLPESMADLLRARRALFSGASTVRDGEQIVITEVVWIEAGEQGLWRIELDEERVTLEQTSSSSLVAELLA